MKRNLAVRIMSICLAGLVGLGAFGSGIYAIVSGSKQTAEQSENTLLFMHNDVIYYVTGESLQELPEEGEEIKVKNVINPNVVPTENDNANFGSVGDTYILVGEDMYYSFADAYYTCVPVITKPVE